MRCKHVGHGVTNYICEPNIAQGEMLGMLHIQFNAANTKTGTDKINHIESRQRLIKITADNLALSLVSLKLREALQVQSVRDPLTCLFNRRHMEESLERESHRCYRSTKGLGVIMADIDHFKKFNDTYGHDAGDIVLIAFANILSHHFRTSDIVCRFGGEEFIIIMPETSKDDVMLRAEDLCRLISKSENLYDGKLLPSVTASFGVAYLDGVVNNKNVLIKAADLALYEAKNTGRNCVILSTNDFK